MPFYLKANDTSPSLQATLKDGNGDAVSLIGATVRFHMRAIGAADELVNAEATVSDADNGIVYYQWNANDTGAIGSYEGEFEVTYAGGEIETFPNNKHIEIEIVDDLA